MNKGSVWFLSMFFMSSLTLISCASSADKKRTDYQKELKADAGIVAKASYDVNEANVLRVASLNIAHGRKDSFSQFFLGKQTIANNLDDIARVLNKHQPQVVALQEADSTKGFNHVKYLGMQAQYPWRVQVSNVDVSFLSYGTGLLSALPFTEAIKHTFAPSWPTLNKGFVLAQLTWPLVGGRTEVVDVMSVHLDFSRQSVRKLQIKEMVDILSLRTNPVIIMGDFNSEWLNDESVIKRLSSAGFTTYQPTSTAFNSYKDKRLDWILISKDLEFVNYKVLPDILSDHAMVIADIRFKVAEK